MPQHNHRHGGEHGVAGAVQRTLDEANNGLHIRGLAAAVLCGGHGIPERGGMSAALCVDLDQSDQVGGDLDGNDGPEGDAVGSVARADDLEEEDGEGDAAEGAASDGKGLDQNHPFQRRLDVWQAQGGNVMAHSILPRHREHYHVDQLAQLSGQS